MSTENDQIIKTFVDKIKQDKLDQRRTVLSNKDQAFVNSVGELADDFDVKLPNSISGIVDVEAEVEELRPATDATNAVLKDFMDDQGIDYDSDDHKADYNEKIDAWLAEQS